MVPVTPAIVIQIQLLIPGEFEAILLQQQHLTPRERQVFDSLHHDFFPQRIWGMHTSVFTLA